MPRDFLYYDEEKQGMMYALNEDIANGGHEIIDFESGDYLSYVYRDGDEKASAALFEGAF